MAFNADSLRLLQEMPAPSDTGTPVRMYGYATADADTVVEADGYFDGAINNGLNKSDIIFAVVSTGGTVELKNYVVRVGGADVTVALQSPT